MQITLNPLAYSNISMGAASKKSKQPISQLLKPLETNANATIPPLKVMKGINPNSDDVFETFTKIDNATRKINFTKDPTSWVTCLAEEVEEFVVARDEYNAEQNKANREHMIEEMGDIFYTAASIAKDSGIDPKEAFKTTNRKFFNRINLMERFCIADKNKSDSLADCTNEERRALWNAAKYKLYSTQAKRLSLEA